MLFPHCFAKYGVKKIFKKIRICRHPAMAGGSPAWQKKYFPHNVHKPSIKGSTKPSMMDREPSEVENRQHKGESKALNPPFLSEGPQCGQKGGSSISSQL